LSETIHMLKVGEVIKIVDPTWLMHVDVRYVMITAIRNEYTVDTLHADISNGDTLCVATGFNNIEIELNMNSNCTAIELLNDEEALISKLMYFA
jgi:hypothetical protein